MHVIPAGFAGDANLQAKVFAGHSYVIATTHYNEHGEIDIAGFTPMSGNAWLYIYGWENGATFMSPDGRTCQLDQPQIKLALQYVVDCYDARGGMTRCIGLRMRRRARRWIHFWPARSRCGSTRGMWSMRWRGTRRIFTLPWPQRRCRRRG